MQHNFGGELHPQLRNSAAPPMTKLRVTVPPNSRGGMHVRVMTPMGLQMCQIPDGLQEGEQFDMVCHHDVRQEVTSNPGAPRLPHPRGGGGAGGIDMVLFNEQRQKPPLRLLSSVWCRSPASGVSSRRGCTGCKRLQATWTERLR